MKIIEGYVQFENMIPVEPECLEQKYPIIVAGISGFLVTPSMYRNFAERKLGPLESPNYGDINYVDDFHWGSVHHSPGGYSNIKACKIFFPEIEDNLLEEVGNKIFFGLESWIPLIMENVSLFLHQDYRNYERGRFSRGYNMSNFSLFKKSTGSDMRIIPDEFRRRTIFVNVKKCKHFNPIEFQEILSDSSNGNSPLLPFHLVFDSERSINDQNYRKSILDSATAVELCFLYLIDQSLPYGEDLKKHTISKHNSLRLKRELLKAMKIILPRREKDYVKDLDSIRNKVIHIGYNPTIDEAKAAFKIADQTVYGLLPKKYVV